MATAYIVDAVRTAGGRRGGKLAGVHPVDLGAAVYDAIAERNDFDTSKIDDVITGCVSQGGEQTIFGESWVHNYNSRLTEMDNADFQGVFAQYPDGRTVMFEGPSFTPEPGIYDKLERSGDGFKLTQQDKTVLYFDNYGDLTRQEDANGNGVTLTYLEQTKFVNLSKIASIKADGGREITFEY